MAKRRRGTVLRSYSDPVKKPRQQVTYTAFQLDELRRCSQDLHYFIENYVYIVDPVKGNVLFKEYEFQTEIINNFANYRNNVALCSRQMGKTTCAAAYLLWESIFKSEQTILVVSNVFSAAIEIMERIRYSYELLPDWLKPGVDAYNRGSISFDNKSRIISRATTKNSGRGLSLSILYCDELSAVDLKKQREFWSAIRPTLSTGGKCIITSTPGNDEDVFAQIWQGATSTYDEHGNEIPNGIGRNEFKATKFTYKAHPDRRDPLWEKSERAAMADDAMFEREHNCSFVSAEETLIDPMVLTRLGGIDPIYNMGTVRWFHRPKPNRTYLIGLDPSMGTGRDDAAIEVYQLPEMLQVAEWRHNRTDVPGQCRILRDITKYIEESWAESRVHRDGEIFWTVENNSIGEAVNIVIKEMGEENFAGTYLSQPQKGGVKRRKGYYMSSKMKLEVCSRFKSLVERDKIHINSKALVTQLKSFVKSGAGYAAKSVEHDDLVMATLLVVKMLERVMSFEDSIREAFQEGIGADDSNSRQPMWGVMASGHVNMLHDE